MTLQANTITSHRICSFNDARATCTAGRQTHEILVNLAEGLASRETLNGAQLWLVLASEWYDSSCKIQLFKKRGIALVVQIFLHCCLYMSQSSVRRQESAKIGARSKQR
jgi:hypothetical protein